jgi:TPR repeat protein
MRSIAFVALFGAILLASPLRAEFGVEHPDEVGVTDPSDFSWRAYKEAMDRFPDRIGIICHNAYELDKSGDHKDAFMFFSECAKRGNPASMINLAEFYDMGWGVPADAVQSTEWLRRAAEKDYSAAQYEYGLALLRGHGAPRDIPLARAWLEKAAAQGDRDAQSLLDKGLVVSGY